MEKTSVFAIKAEKQEIPDKALESLILNHGVMFSATFAEVVDGRPILSTLVVDLKNTKHPHGALGEVRDILTELKDLKTILYFSSSEKDPQPYSLIVNEKKETELAVFLDGNFDDEVETTEGHASEYTFANEYLSSKVLELYEKSEMDIPKLVTLLNGPNVSKELSKCGGGDHMVMAFMASNTQIPTFARPRSPMIKYDWGAVSHDLDAKPLPVPAPKEEPAKEVEVVPVSRLDALRAKFNKTPDKAVVLPGQHTTNSAPAKLNEAPIKEKSMKERLEEKRNKPAETAVIRDTDGNLRLVRVPQFSELKNKRKWMSHRTAGGLPPANWESIKEGAVLHVPMDLLQKLEPKKTIGELMHKYPAATPETAKAALETSDQSTKQTTSVPAVDPHKDKTLPAAPNTPKEDQPVVIPAEHKKHLESKFFNRPRTVALLGKDSKNIMDPALTAHLENKLPEFWEGTRIPSLEATFHFKSQDYQEMGTFSLNTLARAAFDYKNHLVKALQELQKRGGVQSTNVEEVDTSKLSMKERLELKRKKAA